MTACNFTSLLDSSGIELCSFFLLLLFFSLHLTLSEISFVSRAALVRHSPHQHLANLFFSTAPHKSAICRWRKIILISENCPTVLVKTYTKGVMYIKNTEGPMLIISDGKVSAPFVW